ncbi:MAG: aminodeoxychorismate lyase [Cycloclasticus sp.]|mgnify:CR=1 FL=1|nr:aminodeoxychorismate lyase [Cycloclasticus sp.]MBG97270.1 aminodeoxychorismate lyase [Cycloclasticus sp.]HAI97836.1 aminodeoxychorismate lyase [Methylococcaceae bacterium]|tara:strand:- start:716 stop:1579 length:864 start_codon:yes stop_codon:yes gene_type:complete
MTLNSLINGEIGHSINSSDRGFQYGDGLFETILVEANAVCYLTEHLQRLKRGCRVLGFPPIDDQLIEREINQIVANNQNGVIKILLSRGIGERGFQPPKDPEITRVVSFAPTDAGVSKSLRCVDLFLCHTRLSRQPLLAGIKHLNQLERILARQELANFESAEGLMLDVDDNVIEGTMSNLFIAVNDVLMTPLLDNAGVEGVIRQRLIEQAAKEGIECREVELTLEELQSADEIFMTNSLMPVRSVKQFKVNGQVFRKMNNHYAGWALNYLLTDIQRQVQAFGAQGT